jgi:hypothetical protein
MPDPKEINCFRYLCFGTFVLHLEAEGCSREDALRKWADWPLKWSAPPTNITYAVLGEERELQSRSAEVAF